MPRTINSKDLQQRIPPHPKVTLGEAVKRDLFLTYRESAAYMRCTPSQIALWVKSGRIDVYQQPGGRRVLRARDVHDAMRDGRIPASEVA